MPQENWPALHIPNRSNVSNKSLAVHPSTSNPRGQLPSRGTTIAAVCVSEIHPMYSWIDSWGGAVLPWTQFRRRDLWAQPVSTPRTGDQPPLSGVAGAEVARRMPTCKDRVIYQLDCNAYKYYNCITELSLLCGCCMKAAYESGRDAWWKMTV